MSDEKKLLVQRISLYLSAAGWEYLDGAYYREMNVSREPDSLIRRFRIVIQLDSIRLELGYSLFGKIKYEKVASERFNSLAFTDDFLRIGSYLIKKTGTNNVPSN